jgi:hypothetical protein
MKVRFIPALLMFLGGYFPLALIFIIKDLDPATGWPQHPVAVACVGGVALLSCLAVLLVARQMRGGLPVRIGKVANKSGDLFTYTIPYMVSFYNFNLGDWRTLLSLSVFMVLMFLLSYRTQNVFINPVLALAGYGLYDCQFKDGERDAQGLVLSRLDFQPGDTCMARRLARHLYFVTEVRSGRPDAGSTAP